MHKTEEYKGRTINTYTREFGDHLQWNYQIDAGPLRGGDDRALRTEELMLDEALRAAKAEIDRMTK